MSLPASATETEVALNPFGSPEPRGPTAVGGATSPSSTGPRDPDHFGDDDNPFSSGKPRRSARRDAAEEDGARWTPAAELEPSLIELASHAGQAHVVQHLVMAGFTH